MLNQFFCSRLSVAMVLIGADPDKPQRGRKSVESVLKELKIHVRLEIRPD